MPKTLVDGFCLIFFMVIIPLGYMFHLFVSLPYYYDGDESFIYKIHFVFSTYCLVNLVGNYVATFMVDTSIRGEILNREDNDKWKLCASCECFVPPRTWHCNICSVCIMKRDHHCSFTACCVGHHNERYFLMFLFHFMIATIYCSYFNMFFMWSTFVGFSWIGVLKIIFPLAIVLSGLDASLVQVYRVFCILTVIGLVATTGLFFYHLGNVINGRVMYENSKRISDYNLGSWRENIETTLGTKWYLTWFIPFIDSPLPCDGIHWDKMKQTSFKGRWNVFEKWTYEFFLKLFACTSMFLYIILFTLILYRNRWRYYSITGYARNMKYLLCQHSLSWVEMQYGGPLYNA